ncbi:FG-GAP-like repeat-containing protein [Streptomyces sp. SID8499]|uniref:FG-GAP-like repeat-containing protein n=1 Tax=Streptomyces sp. SID8499 TaxID=2706106 RepID=UPI0013CD15D2|nr:FG-GAP-like repeat-containing protein [Streptomyces sp. SID8499]NED34138.1 trypsin-like serine protease [Streptomyces sp. SID8499]
MTPIRHVRVLALVAALAAVPTVLCATPVSAVTGPAAADSTYAFAARLDFGDGLRSCSAALVGTDWIAASAHCFTDDASGQVTAGKPEWKTTATIGRTDLTGSAGQVRDVVEVVPRQDRDLVLARLASPVTGITPVAFAKTAPVAGEELTVAGYGRTKDEWAPLKLHTATLTVDSATGTTVAMHGKTAADAVCAGDAGGPIVRQKDGRTELVALGSQSYQGGCFGTDPAQTSTDAVSPRTDNIAGGNTLTAGTVLNAGDSLTSNAARLTLQADGNLVVVSNAGATVWSTKTAGHPGATARFDTGGDLAVVDADGTTVLWESRTTAAGGKAVLQDRGNFVIYNAKGEAQWGAGTSPRHDYTGDGRSDLADWYDYSDGSDEIHAFPATSTGGFANPVHGWKVAPNNYTASNMKRFTGDFNGDGIADVATFYGYATGKVSLITWLGKGDGTFAAPAPSWTTETGWTFSRMTVNSGDFNGDGRDDVAVWYDYADGSDKLWTFLAKPDGGFGSPFSSFLRTSGWTATNMKFVTGDYNGDGRDDLAALYGYATGEVKFFTFPTTPDGGFGEPVTGWNSLTGWEFSRASVYSGDFNGDGRDDLAVWYDYADGHQTVIGFTPGGTDGKIGSRSELWTVAPDNYYRPHMQLVTGDYNGDGRDDLATFYGYDDGSVKTITWTAKADGTLNAPAHSWGAVPGSWTFDRVHMIERYNSPS